MILRLFILVFLHLTGMLVFAQIPDSLTFVCYSLNKIENVQYLRPILKQLDQLSAQSPDKLKITHIGDSHVQADYWTSSIRRRLQHHFGDGGRGLIFPFSIANTNGPEDIVISPAFGKGWTSKRNVFPDDPMPTGICGITLQSTKKQNWSIGLRENEGWPYHAFEDVTIFMESNCTDNPVKIRPFSGSTALPIEILSNPDEGKRAHFKLNKTAHILQLFQDKELSSGEYVRYYGIYTEFIDKGGLIYNMIGVNGAESKHYNSSEFFYEQLNYLDSDLFIISLGTNEALDVNLSMSDIRNELDKMIRIIKRNHPKAVLMLTTPPDHADFNAKINRRGLQVRNVILEYALENKLPYWDLYEIMGGYGSMQQWKDKSLAQSDKIHFNKKGYDYIGLLFSRALINALHEYSAN